MITCPRPVMTPIASPGLLGRRFRANADYRLIAHADLPASEADLFAGLATNPQHYGFLIPQKVVELGVKAVEHDVADLFVRLAPSGPLPEHLLDSDDERELELRLAALVLDGILEVEIDGTFLAGPEASERLWPNEAASPLGAVARLSREALRLALNVPEDDPSALSAWIYAYNAVPLGPEWSHRLGDEDQVTEALGLHEAGRARRLLGDRYQDVSQSAWQAWERRYAEPSARPQHMPYKLYISPHPGALIKAFTPVISALVGARVAAFKRGRGLLGLLRADKLVVYLESWERVLEVGMAVADVLDGVAPQPVPFTAAATADGLLSWGMDPPPSTRVPGWGSAESWRSWLTNRLSRGLIHARRVGAHGDRAIDFALARLRLEGVDTELWAPAEHLWRADREAP